MEFEEQIKRFIFPAPILNLSNFNIYKNYIIHIPTTKSK